MTLVAENRRLNVEEVRAGDIVLRSAPLQVNVELTGICNIDPPCLFCTGKNFGHNYKPLATTYLDQYSRLLERCEHINEDSFGEPLSHPGLIELAERYTARGQVFSFVTNGLLLTPAKADQLAACGPLLGFHVSFNAATEDTFYKLTGKSFARVVENVRYYVTTYRERNGGKDPVLILTFIVMKINRHEVLDFLRLTRDLGVQALLASLHDRPSVPLGHFGYDFVYEDEMLSYAELVQIGEEATAFASQLGVSCALQWDAARDSAIRGFAEEGVATPCLIPWRFLFIQEHTRKVFACPYHRYPYGNLETSTLEEIWNSDTARDMRRSLAAGEVPRYCLNHGAGCPLVMEEHTKPLLQVHCNIIVGENDFHQLREGWHTLDFAPAPIRWTSRDARFLVKTEGCTHLFVEANVWGTDDKPRAMEGSIELAGHELGRFHVEGPEWNLLEFLLPDGLDASCVEGHLITDEVWVPDPGGRGGDTRELGVAVRRIWAS
ncbi:MAG: hypothetical protein DMF56_24320 [Acidobacteria bacterium]|nr:MAG: hypothetical protein DMF56_24320 [Acidobacteriota bacterium]